MKNMKTVFWKRLAVVLMCLLVGTTLSLTAFAGEVSFEDKCGEVTAITEGLTLEEGIFTNKDNITLDFVSAPEYADALSVAGWRVLLGLDVSEYVTDGELAQANYYTYGIDGWTQVGNISSSGYLNEKTFIISLPVTAEDLQKEKIALHYGFDWDNSGADDTLQVVKMEIDMSRVILIHGEDNSKCSESVDELEIAPTCTEVGYTKSSHCSVCGLPVFVKEEIPALGHDFSEKIINDDHFLSKEKGVSTYYYNCSRADCDVIGTEKTYTVKESDYNLAYAGVTAFTEGLSVNAENPANITVTNTGRLTLDFADVDESLGRNEKGWWAGVKVTADSALGEEELKKIKLRKSSSDEDILFWECKDSSDSDESQYVILWVPVTAEDINSGKESVSRSFSFDWDNNGFGVSTQEITVTLNLKDIEFLHSQGHKAVIDQPAVEPTCLEGGFTAETHCEVCGLVLSERTPVDALGHDFSEKLMNADHFYDFANCVHYDRYFYSCIRCDHMSGPDKTYEDIEGSELLEHEEVRKLDKIHLISPADCENPAWYYMGCKNCDTIFDERFSDGTPLYHSWKIERVTKKATINADGTINFFCDDCGAQDNYPIPIPKVSEIKLSATKYTYNGKAVTPSVTVKDREGTVLVKDKDYTVQYINSAVPGTAIARITFKGNYQGSYDAKYTIEIPATTKIAYASNTNTIKIAWQSVPLAAGYKVYLKTSTGWKALGNTTATSATFKNLPSGTKYTFAVKAAVRVNGTVYWASAYKAIDTTTISPATAKVVAAQNTNTIKLTWAAVTGAEGYAVYYSTQNGWKLLGVTTKTTATFTNLAAGTSFIFAVRSVDLTASGAKVAGEGYTQITTATKPTNPVVSVTTANGDASIKWTGVKGASGYEVYYKSANSGGYVLLGTVGAGTTSFTDTDYTVGSKYVFAVRATKAVQGGYIYSSLGQITVTMK